MDPDMRKATFRLHKPSIAFGPRLGLFCLERTATRAEIRVETPGITVYSSRGVVPHLSRDHTGISKAVKWIDLPFEPYLERTPPILTLKDGSHPIHNFLGFDPDRHIISMKLRDTSDVKELPANGNNYVSARCIRGVRKVTPEAWRSYIHDCKPDLVVPLSDIPFTPPPFSQKRLTKSLERSVVWLIDLFKHTTPIMQQQEDGPEKPRMSINLILPMAGDIDTAARRAFASSLVETVFGKEKEQIAPFELLDDGIFGYLFDLTPLKTSILVDVKSTVVQPDSEPQDQSQEHPTMHTSAMPEKIAQFQVAGRLTSLLQASLTPLLDTQTESQNKLRIATSPTSPHEILILIRDVGIDLFDTHWAQKAADWGVALDFTFPSRGKVGEGSKRDLGHNLYDSRYSHDFGRLADSFQDGASYHTQSQESELDRILPVCPCFACSPVPSTTRLSYSSIIANEEDTPSPFDPPFSRAYIHHLLHTHEMSAHALLVAHNLAVVDAFFQGIRDVLREPNGLAQFHLEVENFCNTYDNELLVFERAKKDWIEVDLARGKGRLAREKAKLEEESRAG